MTRNQDAGHVGVKESTQNTQYDQIGTKYNRIKTLPATEAEVPSVVRALGDIVGKKCLDLACGTGKYTALLSSLGASTVHGYDISPAMIAGAKATYPPAQNPNLHFAVADCSLPDISLPHSSSPSDNNKTGNFDIVLAVWFLNYAGTETELTNMFRVIEKNLVTGGRFVGLTTNVHDPQMQLDKRDFYGIDVLVLDAAYVDPSSSSSANEEVLGVKMRVVVKGEMPFQFDVFQFRKEVYERCAERAGLKLAWKELVLPEDERRGNGYWDWFVERPTFVIVEAVRV
ncbi:S-adenosyl-L-methionine-dependent methyltransferase [Cucurbitaria berberidis CBS 394.84]|uniref:S-adenosyl-L-methionine-dependent methyltransferase n=1 Tax=Cucurbitaria berberidis CBS 394.84 TaxID=1168544 RepID=A0A9P4GIG3_9PLEO|nr:S-adenosyl-L-methionine-dependent methyltransferase [Cucurbitaria berberidis CBS 394.84]KAF1846242.1 S-adenosyl-L-methionine-dependent methyltransferase [Cucurbitaria berberidis CBS 394.84]